MCKSSKLFLPYFMVSLFSISPFVSAKSNDVNVESNLSKEKNSKSETQKEDESDFDVSSLSGSQIGDMLKPYSQELEDFFSTIFDLKNRLKDQSDKAKLIVTYLESCKFVFEKEKNCFIVSVYPKNVDSSNCLMERIAIFNLDSKSKIAFNLARNKSDDKKLKNDSKSDKTSPNEKNKKEQTFGISSLSSEKIKEIGRPHIDVIKMLFDVINEFKNGLIKESKKNEKIMNYLRSCRFVLEKNSSSNKPDSFNINIYSYSGSDVVIDPIMDIELDENSSISFNFIKKQPKNTK